ncbi:MAG: hypothetical protein IKL68_00495 [Clostridia bacterium]|nr:hypothetical protein [Clostridia bacterium]
MQKKKGISLIVLVITIIVMIILAAAVVITLDNSGVINKANLAVNKTNLKEVQDLASLVWMDEYMDEKRGETLKTNVLEKLKEYTDKYNIEVTDEGVTVTEKENTSADKEATITLNTAQIVETIESGTTKNVTLIATVSNVTDTLVWSSNNTDVAAVVGNGTTGLVTLKNEGTAIIQVTANGVNATCNVTVTETTKKIAYRPFTVEDYTCTVEWESDSAQYTVLCDAIDKAGNPVYMIGKGTTKEEYNQMGLKFRKGSWIFLNIGILAPTYMPLGSTGDIYYAYDAVITEKCCPTYQVNGNGSIAVSTASTQIESGYTTIDSTPYSTCNSVEVFKDLSSTATIFSKGGMPFMYDGAIATDKAKGICLESSVTKATWSSQFNLPTTFAVGSLMYTQCELSGSFLLLDTLDGCYCYVVVE